MTRENQTSDPNAPAASADFASEVVQALIRHLDSRARPLERLEILGDQKHGDRTAAILAAAKLLGATAEGVRALRQAVEGAARRPGAR